MKKSTKENKILCFTYGTLMKGNHNNSVLGDAKYICDATIPRHICFDLPYGFPMVIDIGVEIDNYVIGEIWEVDESQLSSLDMLEGYNVKTDDGMYVRRKIKAMDSLGKEYEVFYYLWNRDLVEGSFIVPSGMKWNSEGKY